MRLLLDTNVLIDVVLGRQPFSRDGKRLFVMRYFGDVELWTSAKSFTDVFYIASKAAGHEQAYAAIKAVTKELSICSVDDGDIRRALDEHWEDFEDCIIYQAAQKVKADFIVTRDTAGFSRSRIDAITPLQLARYMEEERHLVYEELSF